MKRGVSSKTWISKAPGSRSRARTRRMWRMFISTERLSSPFLSPSSRSRRLTALLAGLRKSRRTRQPDSASRTSRRPEKFWTSRFRPMPMASSRRAPPKRSSAGSWRCSRTRSEWTETTSAYRSPTRSSTASTGSRSAEGTPAAAAQDLQQPGGGPLGLGEDRLGQRPVAGDDVPGDLQLVQGQLHLAAVVEVRLEAGPVLDHQLPQLRQGQEAQDVVVGRVEEVALAAG